MARAGKLRLFLGLGVPIALAGYGLWKLREFHARAEKQIVESHPTVPIPLAPKVVLPPEADPAGAARAERGFERPGAVRRSPAPLLAGTTLTLEGSAAAIGPDGVEHAGA